MPRFDHMNGEVSVRNLVLSQGGEQFRPGRMGPKLIPPTPSNPTSLAC